MAGGTLAISRAINLHPHFKQQLETLGFKDVHITTMDKDGLAMAINDLRPQLLLADSHFYQCCTPYMLGRLLVKNPGLNIAAVSIADFPADLAMWFIFDGIKSYVSFYDGVEVFYHGLECVRKGKPFISPAVEERIALRREYPKVAGITRQQTEVIRLICNGFKEAEIADTLHISRRTVDTHKTRILTALNARNSNELIRVALALNIVTPDELIFYPKDFMVNPKIKKD